MLNVTEIVKVLKSYNVKPGMPGWYGITDTDPSDTKKRTDTFRADGPVGVLGALGLAGPATLIPPPKEKESCTVAARIMEGAKVFGFETVEQIDAFAAGFDGLGSAEKSKDADAFKAGQLAAKQVS